MDVKDGGPAFPTHDGRGDGIGEDGMSLRKWYAGKAMKGMLSCQDFMNEISRTSSSKAEAREKIAYFAFAQADAMLNAESGAEIVRLRAIVIKLQDERPRLEQLLEEYQPGMTEYRLAEALLDALDKYEAAEAAREA